MKITKVFLTVSAMAIAMNVGAQKMTKTKVNKTTTETTMYMPDSTIVTSTKTIDKGSYDMGYHLMPELKLGACNGSVGWGANLVLEREFHKYLAWDLVSLDFSAPFDFDFVNIGIKTGLRAFSPRFWGNKVRGFTSVGAGWDCMVVAEPNLRSWRKAAGLSTSKHGVGVSWGIGLQIQKHVFVGYTLEYSSAVKNTSHYGKFGYRF